MKRVFITILLINSLFADNLDMLIEQFKSAPKEQKYIYMNRIKLELRKLSATQRANKIRELRAKLNIKQKGKKINGEKMGGAKMKGIIKSNQHKNSFAKGLKRGFGKGKHGAK